MYEIDGCPLKVLETTSLKDLLVDRECEVDIVILKDENVAILGFDEMAKNISINMAECTVNTVDQTE